VAAGRDVSQTHEMKNGMVGEMATPRAEWISCCSYNELCANSALVVNAHMLKQTLCIFALPPNYSTPRHRGLARPFHSGSTNTHTHAQSM
jgi:hypothetical protein